MSHTSPQLDRKAPRAEPEEDIDVLRPGAEDALLENQSSSETEESARMTLGAESLAEEKMADLKQVAQILEALKHQEDSDEFISPVIPHLQDEGAEQTGNPEMNKEPQKRLPSDSQNILEQPEIPRLIETEQDVTLAGVAGANVTKWENSQVSEVSQQSPFTENYRDDASPPPFADKSDEKEEDIKGISSYSAPLPAVPSDKQQEALFSHSCCESVVRAANQEAAQQVCSQSTPPMSMVAMELSNQGEAGSQGCVLALTETHNRAGERREGKTGGEEAQKDSAPETEKVAGKQDREGLVKPEERGTHLASSRDIRMESDSSDDSQSDSGVSTDSLCNTLEGNATLSAGTPLAPLKETPIEREIRRSIEREHSLRRSRGLPSPPTEPEYVEIPRKAVLSQSIIIKSEKYQGKDRQYAGKKMQLEIHEEVQREQDLVRLGKVPGFYDKGTTQELKERKVIFEAFQKADEASLTVTKSKASSSSVILNTTTVSTSTADSISVFRSKSASSVPQGQGVPDTCQDFTQEKALASSAQILCQQTPDPELITEVDFGNPDASSKGGGHVGIKKMEQDQGAAGAESSPRENPFFKLRSSNLVLRVEQDIREAQHREQELYRQRISLYGSREGATAGRGPEDGSEKKSFTVSPMRPSTAARHSIGKLGTWPPAQAEDEARCQEVFSPRTPRQKTPLVQRWESGLINGHNEEDD